MTLYLNCDTCLQIWKDYGVLLASLRSKTAPINVAIERITAAEQAFLSHQAITHPMGTSRS